MPIPYRLFQKVEKEGISQFYKASVTLMPKPNKDVKGKKLLTSIPHEYRHTNLLCNCSKLNLAVHARVCAHAHTHSKILHDDKSRVYSRNASLVHI